MKRLGVWVAVGSLGMAIALSGWNAWHNFAIAQSLSCIEEREANSYSKLYELKESAQRNLNAEKPDKAAEDLIRSFQIVQGMKMTRDLSLNFMEVVNGTQAQPGILEELVDRYTEIGEGDRAASVLAAAAQVSNRFNTGYSYAKTKTLAGIGRLYGEIGQRDIATATIARSLQAETGIRGAEFKTKALIEIARAYIAIAEIDKTGEMLTRSLQQSQSVTYTNAFEQAWDLQPIAIQYAKIEQFDKALEIAGNISDTYYRSDTLAAIAKELAAKGQIDRAQTVINPIAEVEIKARTLAEIGVQAAKLEQTDKAIALFSEALRLAKTITDDRNQIFAIGPILMQYAEAGQPDRAKSELTAIEAADWKAKILGKIAVQYAILKERDKAVKTAEQAIAMALQVSESYEQEFILIDMIGEYREVQLYDAAIRAARSIPYPDRQQKFLLEIATTAAQQGDDEIAVRAAQIVPGNLAAIAFEYEKLGQSDRVAALLQQAIDGANSQEVTEYKFEALAAIAIEYAKAGQTAKAEEMFARVRELGGKVQENSYIWVTVFERFLQAQQYDFALEIATAMKDESFKSTAFNTLAQKAIEDRQNAIAERAIEALQQPADRVSVLLAIADNYIESGQLNLATETLAKAFEIARTIPGEESQILVFKVETDPEGNVISQTEVDDPSDRGSLYEEIALRYARSQQYERAIEVARSLENPATRNALEQRLLCYR